MMIYIRSDDDPVYTEPVCGHYRDDKPEAALQNLKLINTHLPLLFQNQRASSSDVCITSHRTTHETTTVILFEAH